MMVNGANVKIMLYLVEFGKIIIMQCRGYKNFMPFSISSQFLLLRIWLCAMPINSRTEILKENQKFQLKDSVASSLKL